MQEKWSWIEGSHGMRAGLLDSLDDADLAFTPGGQAMTLGALCREMGEVEYSYLQSLKTFKQTWDVPPQTGDLASSVSQLKAWYATLDAELEAVVAAFSDEDLQKAVARPGGYAMPVEMQLDVYVQALLIFFGKATIYFKVLSKALPELVREYIW